MYYTYVESPVGPLLLAGDRRRLTRISFTSGRKVWNPPDDWQRTDEPFAAAAAQLAEYFAGVRRTFDLPLGLNVPPFQARVLEQLRAIPYGETRSYKDIAIALGDPRAVRAVGSANGSNPLPIVIPCHRVIGSDGSLTGFGGGLDAKRYLLDLERCNSGLFGKPLVGAVSDRELSGL